MKTSTKWVGLGLVSAFAAVALPFSGEAVNKARDMHRQYVFSKVFNGTRQGYDQLYHDNQAYKEALESGDRSTIQKTRDDFYKTIQSLK